MTTTETLTMYDASTPPVHPPTTDVVAGYLGGDTPHVWTHAEWGAQSARYRLPIWVRSNPQDVNATHDATAAVQAARALGVPHGALIALDVETAVDPGYVNAFGKTLALAGYSVILYGSRSTVTRNPAPSRGYWVANWTGYAHLAQGSTATQYKDAGSYDLSVIVASAPLWDSHTGKVKGAPAPKPVPKPSPPPKPVFIPVKRGESLASIAELYGHTTAELWAYQLKPGIRPAATQETLRKRAAEEGMGNVLRLGSTVAIPPTWHSKH